MEGRTRAILHHAIELFNFGNVFIPSGGVQLNLGLEEVVTKALELVVPMTGGDGEAAGCIQSNHGLQTRNQLTPALQLGDGPKLQMMRDCEEKGNRVNVDMQQSQRPRNETRSLAGRLKLPYQQ